MSDDRRSPTSAEPERATGDAASILQKIGRVESGGVAAGLVQVDEGGVANIGGHHYQVQVEARKSETLYAGVPGMVRRFLGRETLVQNLVDALTAGGEARAMAVHGLPGVGKTSLAVALAHHTVLLDHFSGGVLWGGLGRTPNAAETQATWDGALGIGPNLAELAKVEQRQALLTSFLAEIGKPVLVVLDDAWQLDSALDLKLGAPNVVHLLTTRDWSLAQAFADPGPARQIPELAEDPSHALLRGLAPDAWAHDPDAARALAGSTGGLPLALELVGSYLAAPQRNLLPALTDRAFAALADPAARLKLAARRLGGASGQQSLAQAIRLSVDDLAELSPQAAEAFYALGAFAPKPARFDLDAALAVAGADDETLALLVVRSLLEMDAGGHAAIHQVLADYARTKTRPDTIDHHRGYYLAVVNGDRGDWQSIEAVYPQVRYAFADAPDKVEMVDALSTFQPRRGLWGDLLGWLAQALTQASETGDSSAEARMLSNYGYVHSALGDKEQALEYYNQALPLRRAVGDRAGEATTLNNIGGVQFQLGNVSDAIESQQQVIQIFRDIGAVSEEATALSNIAAAYHYALGETDKAIEMAEASIRLLESRNLPQDAMGQTLEQKRAFLAELTGEAVPARSDEGFTQEQLFGLTNAGRVTDRSVVAIRLMSRSPEFRKERFYGDP